MSTLTPQPNGDLYLSEFSPVSSLACAVRSDIPQTYASNPLEEKETQWWTYLSACFAIPFRLCSESQSSVWVDVSPRAHRVSRSTPGLCPATPGCAAARRLCRSPRIQPAHTEELRKKSLLLLYFIFRKKIKTK